MIINVAKVRKEFGSSEVFGFDEMLESLRVLDGSLEFTRPVSVWVKATNLNHSILLRGEIKTQLRLSCSRCLDSFEMEIDTEIVEELCHTSGVSGYLADHPEAQEEENYTLFSSDVIDLEPLVAEQIILALPMKPLCTEDCRGLCPQCGSNLNSQECSCELTQVDPRLAGLAKFLTKE